MSGTDPRDVITPDAFAVAPHLLGLPLARPSRRAAAMLVDLLLVAFLVHAGGGVLFGLAAAAVFFRIARRRPGVKALPRPVRVAFGVLGTVVLFAAASSLWDRLFEHDHDEEDEGPRVQVTANVAGRVARKESGVANALTAGAALIALRNADDQAEAEEHAREFATRMGEEGMEPAEVREALTGVAAEVEDRPWVSAAVERVLAEVPAGDAGEVASDSLARAYAAALSSGDTAAARVLRPTLAGTLAADTLRRLDAELERLRGEVREVERELEEERREVGILALLERMADELGLGFGWTGLYFTAFLTLWRGQTPGKRMTRIRVVRLNGAPITWWAAFERFGGYAASIFTGLLGFFQIFWDRNRQALHDKISETVVVRVPRAGLDS
ncbi:MAG TPA: RDD family protein [Longimicrobiaceae bacterium]|nr:RDD family protein [Longimicrobiaceae bacterium]